MLVRICPAVALAVPSRLSPKVAVLLTPQITAEISGKVGLGLPPRTTPRTVPGTVPRVTWET